MPCQIFCVVCLLFADVRYERRVPGKSALCVLLQVVDCADASAKEGHKAEHAANAFDTEKVALMHGLFKMLQAPPGQFCAQC